MSGTLGFGLVFPANLLIAGDIVWTPSIHPARGHEP
jgi:hypothetical protein